MWVDLEIPMIRDLKYPFLYSFLQKKAVPNIELNVFFKMDLDKWRGEVNNKTNCRLRELRSKRGWRARGNGCGRLRRQR